MSKTLDEKVKDVAQWWDWNKRTAMSMEQELKFTRRLIENLFDVITLLANDIRSLEGRPAESLGRALYTPRGVQVQGDLRKVG